MENKDKSLIPFGHYCYHIDRSYDGEGLTPMSVPIVTCPYRGYKEVNGVNVPYCSYLDSLGWKNGFTDDEFNKLIDFYGSEDKVFDALELDLLWDGCKCCGENYEEDLFPDDPMLELEENQVKYREIIDEWLIKVKKLREQEK